MKLRWFSEPLIGPLASWELVRLARRGHAHRARLLVLYLLCLAFIVTPFLWIGDADVVRDLLSFNNLRLSVDSKESLGALLSLCLWEAVLLGVATMMPGFATLSVAQEKERDTLQMLLTTGLSDHEIVLGKAAGRLGFVLAAAAAAIPLISASELFGYVRPLLLIGGCVLTCSTATLCAAIGVQAACATRDLRQALVLAYGMTSLALLGPIGGPFVVIYLMASSINSILGITSLAVGYPLLQLIFAVAFFRSAIQKVRCDGNEPITAAQDYYLTRDEWRLKHAQPEEEKTPDQSTTPEKFLLLPYEKQLERLRDMKKRRHSRRRHGGRSQVVNPSDAPPAPNPPPETPASEPRVPNVPDSNPLLWKERYISARNTGASPWGTPLSSTIIIAVSGVLLMMLGTALLIEQEVTGKTNNEYGGHLWLVGSTLVCGAYLVPCGIGLAAVIARERHKKTLDTLLSLPMSRREILRTKVRSVLERAALLVPAAVLGPGIAFGAERDWQLGVAASGFVIGGIILVIGFGTLLSVKCPTEVRALRLLAPVVVIVLGVPVAVWNAGNAIAFHWALIDLTGFGLLACAAGLFSWRQANRLLERLE